MYGQKIKVLNHLRNNHGLTSMEAFTNYGITRLAAVIYDLRQLGHNIESQKELGVNRYGEECRYVRYWLHEQKGEN